MSYQAAEAISGLFQPDVVLPSQFSSRDNSGLAGGERKLMAALLSDGVEAYVSSVVSGRKRDGKYQEICAWVETKDYAYVFSFDNVCECLGIDPDYLRLGLARYIDSVRQDREFGSGKRVWKKIRRPRK